MSVQQKKGIPKQGYNIYIYIYIYIYTHNKNILFFINFFTNESCPAVSYLMVSAQNLKDARFKIKIWETLTTQKRLLQAIAITQEAFKNENYETYFHNEFYFSFVNELKPFFLYLYL